jgi:nitroreductase
MRHLLAWSIFWRQTGSILPEHASSCEASIIRVTSGPLLHPTEGKALERHDVLAASGADPAPAQALARLLVGRFSCRRFLPQPVPRTTIVRILELAQLSASWCNSQAWQLIVTEGAGTERFRAALYEHVSSSEGGSSDFPGPARYHGVYLDRRRESGWQLYEKVGVAPGDRAASSRQMLENFRFFGAPHVMIITSDADLGVYGAVDCGSYVANLMLVAQSFGIATIAQAALAMRSNFIRAYFKLSEDRKVVCGISFGYPDEAHPANGYRTRRAQISDVVRWAAD